MGLSFQDKPITHNNKQCIIVMYQNILDYYLAIPEYYEESYPDSFLLQSFERFLIFLDTLQ